MDGPKMCVDNVEIDSLSALDLTELLTRKVNFFEYGSQYFFTI